MKNELVEELLEAAGLPVTSFGERLAALPEAPRRFHQALFDAFVETGTVADLPAAIAGTGLEVDASDLLGQLAAANLVALDECGSLTGVFPFSVRPTRHHVEIVGGPALSAMCAIDALAIPAMFGRDATIVSADPLTGIPIAVRVSGDELDWDPASAVVVVGHFGDGPLAVACCAHIDFYADETSANRALASVSGMSITIGAARDLGGAVFAGLGKAR